MLDEYICLKEQKVFLEQEKLQVQNLLRGMQQVMNGYNASANLLPSALVPASSGPLLQQSSPGFISGLLFLLLVILYILVYVFVIWDLYNISIGHKVKSREVKHKQILWR